MKNFALNTNITFGTSLFGTDISYSIQSVNLPGLTVGTVDLPNRYEVLVGKVASRNMDYNDLTMTVICDENLTNWYKLIEIILSHKGINSKNDAWLKITDNNGRKVLEMSINNIIITSIGDLAYDMTSENTELVFELTIKYDYYSFDSGASLSDEHSNIEPANGTDLTESHIS